MLGYKGKILRVDLSEGQCSIEPLDPKTARDYIGGRGFGVKILLDELPPETGALDPENILVLATGPLVGSRVSTAGRYMAIAKTPLNNGIVSANSGGMWPAELKFAGFDAIVIKGKAEKPVYLYIEGESVQILDAGEIWGRVTSETVSYLQNRHEGCKVLNIGPAGEKASNMASIMNDLARAAGRGGTGAVMGSKNLKAIAVKALERNVSLADEEAINSRVKELLPHIVKSGESYTKNGTLGIFNLVNTLGLFPTYNYQHNICDHPEKIDSKALNENYFVKREACFRCPHPCGRVSKVDGKEYIGPEYEAVWSFGPDCGSEDLATTIIASHICNEYGLDVISAGATIAAAMELYQRGYIKDGETDGLSLKWGDTEAILKWIERMGTRSGLGDKMADGSYDLCLSYGVPEYSMSVKKLEMPAYDPRGAQGHGLGYATANRGACHVTANAWIAEANMEMNGGTKKTSTQGKEKMVIGMQNKKAAVDSLGLCGFGAKDLTEDDLIFFYSRATGFDVTPEEFRITGERIYNAERLFSVRSAGYSAKDDVLPPRLTDEPIGRGPLEGEVNKLSDMIDNYYAFRGWDENGRPTPEKLQELNLH